MDQQKVSRCHTVALLHEVSPGINVSTPVQIYVMIDVPILNRELYTRAGRPSQRQRRGPAGAAARQLAGGRSVIWPTGGGHGGGL